MVDQRGPRDEADAEVMEDRPPNESLKQTIGAIDCGFEEFPLDYETRSLKRGCLNESLRQVFLAPVHECGAACGRIWGEPK